MQEVYWPLYWWRRQRHKIWIWNQECQLSDMHPRENYARWPWYKAKNIPLPKRLQMMLFSGEPPFQLQMQSTAIQRNFLTGWSVEWKEKEFETYLVLSATAYWLHLRSWRNGLHFTMSVKFKTVPIDSCIVSLRAFLIFTTVPMLWLFPFLSIPSTI